MMEFIWEAIGAISIPVLLVAILFIGHVLGA